MCHTKASDRPHSPTPTYKNFHLSSNHLKYTFSHSHPPIKMCTHLHPPVKNVHPPSITQSIPSPTPHPPLKNVHLPKTYLYLPPNSSIENVLSLPFTQNIRTPTHLLKISTQDIPPTSPTQPWKMSHKISHHIPPTTQNIPPPFLAKR